MRNIVIGLTALLAGPTPALAAEHWGSTRITTVAAVGDDQLYPQYSRTIFIGVADRSWLPEKCRKTPGLLARDDQSALFGLAKVAFENQSRVDVKASDSVMIGDYCTFFQITVHAPEGTESK